ncbi:hypothetical protein VP01_4650g2 [Puccinia sorghi]|uniref:Uncharacterized protein n=1 Tax=Puccinia sorghi TaxID=27349 RepID=A0A0L6UNA3_9BASI|nr:hypothetical protein VP01_4650g2 [Puccinia sorghi]
MKLVVCVQAVSYKNCGSDKIKTQTEVKHGDYLFHPWDKLKDKDKDNSNSSSTFIHGSKYFIHPFSSSTCSWGGKMWDIGWRNYEDFFQP